MNSIYQADATYPCNTTAKRVSTELFLFSLFEYTTNTMIKKNTCRNFKIVKMVIKLIEQTGTLYLQVYIT